MAQKGRQHHWSNANKKKITMRYLTSIRMANIKEIPNAGKDMETREPWCTAGGIVNWWSNSGKWYRDSSINSK